VGDKVDAGETVAELHTANRTAVEDVGRRVERAIRIGPGAVHMPPLIHSFVDEKGCHPWTNR
jgi:thymidine phosphorylase